MVDYTVPLNYANQAVGQTPEQVKTTYDYAKALLGNSQKPIQHWTQGVQHLVEALVGGNLDFKAAQAEKLGLKDFAGKQKADIPAQNYPAAPVGTLAPPPFPAPLPSGGDSNEMDRSKKAISSIESGGSYDKLGPVIPKTGDRAYGKYQVMGANVPSWTEAALGKRMTPDEFVKDQAAQDAVFQHKFGEYTKKYGPEGAARAWFAGEGNMNNMGAKDMLGTTVGNYGRRFSNSFAGPSDFSKAPAVAAMSSALRGGPSDAGEPGVQVAAGGKSVPAPTGGPTPPAPNLVKPDPSAGQTLIDPRLVKPQPGYTPDQLQAVMEHPFAAPAQREGAHQMMLQRGQTVEMKSPTGVGTILVDPNNPNVQQYIAPAPHYGTEKISDSGVERPVSITYGPGGQPQIMYPPPSAPAPTPAGAVGPRSDAAPVAPAGGGLPSNGTPGTPTAENAPAAPVGAADVPVKVASTDPTAGISATVGTPTVPPVEPVPANPAATRLAQSIQTAPPGVRQEDFNIIQGLKKAKLDAEAAQHQRINDQDVMKAAQENMNKLAFKRYEDLDTQAQSARSLMPNVDLALALMNDPTFNSGMLSGAKDVWNRFREAAFGDKYANAPNETFDKLMASNVLGTMKSALAGLGQVRLAEIQLLDKANGNRNNTVASNRAVLEITRLGLQKIDQINGMSHQYMAGEEVVDPISGKVLMKANVGKDGEIAPRLGLDHKFDSAMRDWNLAHPSLTKEQVKNYEKLFTAGETEKPTKAAESATAPTGTFPTPPKDAVEMLKKNPASRAQFEKIFGPADSYLGK